MEATLKKDLERLISMLYYLDKQDEAHKLKALIVFASQHGVDTWTELTDAISDREEASSE